jgi:phosphoribosylformylglycinamidine synthase
MWQFVRGVEGLRDAARAFDTPVISGNVSFYNETAGRAIPPTPTVAVVGILEDVSRHRSHFFTRADDLILMVRTAAPNLAASEYEALFGGRDGKPLTADLNLERRLVEGLIDGVDRGLIESAHDVSEGGIAVALAEACFHPLRKMGAEVSGLGTDPELFGEGPSTVIISAAAVHLEELKTIFEPLDIIVLGRVTEKPRLKIAPQIDEDVAELVRIYEASLPRRMSSND